MPGCRVGILRIDHTRSTALDPKLTFWCVSKTIWVHPGPFGCFTKLGAKRAELVQKFVKRSRIGIFRNERTRSTPLDPKLMFWCVLYYLGAYGTVWLPYETRCKMGRTSEKFVPRSRVGFLRNGGTRSTPCDPKLTFGAFVLFGCIRDCLVALRNSMQNGPNKCKSSCLEVTTEFFATNTPYPPHWTLK